LTKTFGYPLDGFNPIATLNPETYLRGLVTTTPVDFGSLVSGSITVAAYEDNDYVKMVVMEALPSSGNWGKITPNGISNPVMINTGTQNVDFTWATPPTMTAFREYAFCLIFSGSGDYGLQLNGESNAGIKLLSENDNNYTSPTDYAGSAPATGTALAVVLTYTPRPSNVFGYTGWDAKYEEGFPDTWGPASTLTTPSDFASIVSGSAFVSGSSAGINVKMVIVKRSDLTIVPNGVSSPVTLDSGSGKVYNFTFPASPTMLLNTAYTFGLICDSGVVWYDEFYISGDGELVTDSSNSYTSPTDPTDAGIYSAGNFKPFLITYNLTGSAIISRSGMISEGLVIII